MYVREQDTWANAIWAKTHMGESVTHMGELFFAHMGDFFIWANFYSPMRPAFKETLYVYFSDGK